MPACASTSLCSIFYFYMTSECHNGDCHNRDEENVPCHDDDIRRKVEQVVEEEEHMRRALERHGMRQQRYSL